MWSSTEPVSRRRNASAGGNSPRVVSNQAGVHDALGEIVARHLRSDYRRPVPDTQRRVFESLDRRVREHGGTLILDSGCGTGAGTRLLAAANPEQLVIGIDRSAARLARHAPAESRNLVLARADCVDVWRLAAAARWPVRRHLLYYPNPWPKAKHVSRRWHGHPVFPAMLELGGVLELRTNWAIYAQEFSLALELCGYPRVTVETVAPDPPAIAASPFEAKYRASGHALYRVACDLAATDGTGARARRYS